MLIRWLIRWPGHLHRIGCYVAVRRRQACLRFLGAAAGNVMAGEAARMSRVRRTPLPSLPFADSVRRLLPCCGARPDAGNWRRAGGKPILISGLGLLSWHRRLPSSSSSVPAVRFVAWRLGRRVEMGLIAVGIALLVALGSPGGIVPGPCIGLSRRLVPGRGSDRAEEDPARARHPYPAQRVSQACSTRCESRVTRELTR